MNQTYKEVYLQPESLSTINKELPEILSVLEEVFPQKRKTYKKIIFTGCGTSYYLAQTAAQLFTSYSGVEAVAVPCSELYFFPALHVGSEPVLVLPITRKSHTTEVRMAIDKVKSFSNVKTLSITCDPLSKEYNDYMLLASNTAETSVVMTRSYTSMVYLCYILALYVGEQLSELEQLSKIETICQKLLEEMDGLAKRIIAENPKVNLFVTLGQGEFYGVANECTNKMKEMGIVNSEAYHSLEYRHGPMSLASEKTFVMTLVHSQSKSYDKKLLEQLSTYGCVTAAIGKEGDELGADYHLATTEELNDSQLSIFLGMMGQLLGLYIAEMKGINPDQPNNLTQAIVL